MTSVVVFGATGFAGGNIVTELLHRGHSVVGVARDPGVLDDVPELELRTGSVFDDSFVAEVVAGAEVVVLAIRASGGEQPLKNALAPLGLLLAGSGARLGVVGGAGSLLTREGGPYVIDDRFPEEILPEARGQMMMLEALQASDPRLDWFYLSPARKFGSFNPGQRTGRYRLGGDVAVTDASGVSFISGADFAIAFVDELEQAAHRRRRFTVGY